MDAHVRRELVASISLLWTDERWLWSGGVAALAGFALWVGVTGAALFYGGAVAGIDLSIAEPSRTGTIAFAAVVVLWTLAPAAVVTLLVDRALKNVSGNVHRHYRFRHPFLLLVPVLALYGLGIVGGVVLGSVPPVLAAGLAAVGLLVLVRTLVYSYRVFSFSAPLLVRTALFFSLAVVAAALLVGAGNAVGREAVVEATARDVAGRFGTALVPVATGTTTVGGVTVSTLFGLAAVLPVGVALLYVLVQSLVGAVFRLWKPTVPRSSLRTGQRYPEFAQPIAEKTTGQSRETSMERETSDKAPEEPPDGSTEAVTVADGSVESRDDSDSTGTDDPSGEDDDVDDVSHTRVFTAPEDGEFDDDHRCPDCAETFDPDADFAYCPSCGTKVE